MKSSHRTSGLSLKVMLISLISVVVAPQLSVAALDYHTYVVQLNDNWVYHGNVQVDSVSISYVLTRLGSVALEASSLSITSKGTYLDIVEEGTLSGNIENQPNNSTLDFLFQGSLPIPPMAAVRGLEVIHDDTLFQAKLKKMVYSLNNQFADSNALAASLNDRVAFLEQLSSQGFTATFAKVSLGQPITVRLRYELPMPGSPSAPISIPVIFQPSGDAPKTVSIAFFENDSTAGPFQWVGASGPVTFRNQDIHTVAYSPSFTFQRVQPPHTLATLQATDFGSGDWSGHYLLVNAGLNDSMMTLLSHPMDVVFLWRWNNPANFVALDGQGLKTLSVPGLLAAAEAQYMRRLAVELAARGHRFGLLHVIDGRDSICFAPAAADDSGFTRLLAYLDGWNAQNLYAAYQNASSGKPGWAPITWSDSNSISRSQAEFSSALDTIQKSFPKNSDLRHIIMLGAGDASTSDYDLTNPDWVQKRLDSTTITNYNAQWPGVNLTQALAIPGAPPLQYYPSVAALPSGLPNYFPLPIFQPTSVEFRAFTPNHVHSVVLPFSLEAQSEAMMKSSAAFNDSVELQGIDALGHNTRSLAVKPIFTTSAQDSGLARLWAADPDRIFEISEANLGLRYNILTKDSYFGASVGSGVVIGPQGLPIFSGRSAFSTSGPPRLQIVANFLWLHVQPEPGMTLRIYDVQGRLLLTLKLDAYLSQAGFRIPLSVFRGLGLSRFTVVLRSGGRDVSATLWVGGAP